MVEYVDRIDASTIPVLPLEQRVPFKSTDEAFEEGWRQALEMVAMMEPAADVVEVRYCRFSLEEARRRESVYKCSACGNYLTVRADTLNGGRADMNYCPFCGRKVIHKGQDGGQDDV